MATFQDIIENTYRILGEASDNSESYDVDTVVKPSINRLVNKICKGQVKNIVTGERYRAGDLPFLRRQQFYEYIEDKRTREVASAGASTLELSNVLGLSSSGYFYLQGEVLAYTSIDTNTLQGVTGITVEHRAGEKVYPLYTLPDNISKPFTLFRVDSNEEQYEIPFEDIRYGFRGYASYSLVQDNSGNDFLLVRGLNDGDIIQMFYYLNSTDLVDTDDVSIIPDPYAIRIIPNLVAGELLRETEEDDVAQAKLIKGYTDLSDFYEFYTNQTKVHHRTIGARNVNFNTYGYGYYGQRRRNIHSNQIV